MLLHGYVDQLDEESAIAEAKRRWGPNGAISVADQYAHSRCLVGELRGGRFWILGRGSNWEAAFADSEARPVMGSRRRAVH
jgi:hypothetical protein